MAVAALTHLGLAYADLRAQRALAEDLRIETARRLLEQDLPIARVASRCGFGSEETLRRAFLRKLGVTPQAYRERFAA